MIFTVNILISDNLLYPFDLNGKRFISTHGDAGFVEKGYCDTAPLQENIIPENIFRLHSIPLRTKPVTFP